MYYYKAKIQYDGTGYAGFQWQEDLLTIQSDFNKSLSSITDAPFSTTAASRTDSGVHALEQIVKMTIATKINTESFMEFMNQNLAKQILCTNLEECSGEFHPSAHSLLKEYRYFFTNNRISTLHDRRFIANISNQLNIQEMQIALKSILGQHDFCNFQSAGSNVKSSIRQIHFCELAEVNPHEIFGDHPLFKFSKEIQSCYQLRIEANGFLKQMIRHLMSGLWTVGSGKMSREQFIHLIDNQKSKKQLWKVAPPNGLFLYKITY